MASAVHAEASRSDASVGVGVVAAPASDDDHGRTLARALSRLAPAGQTLLSAEDSWVPASARCEPFGSVQLDPLDEPLAIVRVISVASSSPAPRRRTVGRDSEIASIRHLAVTVLDRGRGAVIHAVGEAGIGKSHLLMETQRLTAEHGFGSLRISHDPDGRDHGRSVLATLAYALLETDSARGADEPEPPEPLEPGLHPFFRDLLDLPHRVEDRSLFEAMMPSVRASGHDEVLRALVRARLAEGPLLLVVEDMHWSTSESRRGLQAIASVFDEGPLLVAMTSRPANDPVDEAWIEAAGGPPFVRFALERLRPDDAQVLAAAIMSRRRAPWMVASDDYVRDDLMLQCIERSGGHPLLLEQMLLDAQSPTGARTPDSVAELVATRLRSLPPELQQALGIAAAIGERFDAELLDAALEGAAWTPDPAVDAGLLLREGVGHRFVHALVRDAIYATLEEDRRRSIHLVLARHMAHPGYRAEQLERARHPGAARAYLAAAQREDQATRLGAARVYLERGLGLGPDPSTGLELHALLGRVHVDEGRGEEGRQAFDAMLSLAQTPAERSRALIGIVSALRLRSRLDEAEAPLREAEQLATEHGLEEISGLCAYYRGCLLFSQGEVRACQEQHEQATEYARRSGQPRNEALALSGLGDAYYAQGRLTTSLATLERCIALARAHGFGRIEVANLHMSGILRALGNELEEGLEVCRESARMASRVGNRRAQMLSELNVGISLTLLGRAEEGLVHIERSKQIATQMEAQVFHAMIQAFESRTLRRCGKREQARRAALASLEVARVGSMRFFGGVALGALALSAMDPDERVATLAEGEALLAGPCISHNYVYFYEDAIDACIDAKQWAQVEDYADRLDAVTVAEPIPRCRTVTARGRALARLGRSPGDREALEALRTLRESLIETHCHSLLTAVDDALSRGEGR